MSFLRGWTEINQGNIHRPLRRLRVVAIRSIQSKPLIIDQTSRHFLASSPNWRKVEPLCQLMLHSNGGILLPQIRYNHVQKLIEEV